MMFVATIAWAIVTLVLSVVTVLKSRVMGGKKALRSGLAYAGIAAGLAATAFWPELWNWGVPPLLIVATAMTSDADK